MTLLLLDTTFLIDAERSGGQLDDLIADDDDVAIAAITVAELLVGVGLAAKRHKEKREAFVNAIVDAIPVLPYDVATAAAHATLLTAVRAQGRPRGAHDLMITATALATRRSVVSADKSAFDDLPGVAVISHRD